MAYTREYLANWALTLAQAPNINLLTDPSPSAKQVSLFYENILQDCLRRGNMPWNFATKRLTLLANATVPDWGFTQCFDLPGDFCSMQAVSINEGLTWMNWDKCKPFFRLEHNQLLCNYSSLHVRYTSNDTIAQPWRMTPDFAEYFVTSLAALIVLPLTNDRNRRTDLTKDAEIAYRHAAAAMSMEDSPDQLPESPYITIHEQGSDLWPFGGLSGWPTNGFGPVGDY